MKVLCFGDSNTYGYDPRSPFGDRYGTDDRWTDILAAAKGWEVINAGVNGREIPVYPFQQEQAAQLVRRAAPELLIVMLGGNDLLCNPRFTAEDTAERMEAFLKGLSPVPTLLIAPPPMEKGAWVGEERLITESRRLAAAYAAAAARLGIFFADAAVWNVGLTFDGVHFTESGHAAFAAGLASVLETLPLQA